MELPKFKYHPDPIKTGSVVESDETCDCCQKQTGYIYSGSLYSRNRPDYLCPWCIADGSAAKKYDGEFIAFFTGEVEVSTPDSAINTFILNLTQKIKSLLNNNKSDEIYEELSKRTPGFSSFQEEQWQFHCNDACEFHGLATTDDFKKISEEETKRLIDNSSLSLDEIEEFKKEKEDTELHYIFKFICHKCGEIKFMEDLD